MTIKVIRCKVRVDGKTYGVGDTIEKLSKEQEESLVEKGYAEYVEKAANEKPNRRNKESKAKEDKKN